MPPTTARSNGTAPPQAVAPIAPLPPPTPVELTTEYVAGGGWSWYSRLARALPPTIDDLTSDLGDDLYERMMVDAAVARCLTTLKASVLEDGVDLNPAVKDDTDPEYELAKAIRDEAEAMFEDLETGFDDFLWDMSNHMALGNMVAEQRYALKPGAVEKRDLLQLVALKPKPRRTYAFVVDAYLNVIGLIGQRPGQSNPYLGQVAIDPAQSENILPREKFVIATFRPRNSDPRGTSILRPAYDPWSRKRQMLPEWFKFMAQFASPSIWGTTPEKAMTQPPLDALANPTLDGSGNLNPPFTPSADPPISTDVFGQNPRASGVWTMTPEQRLAAAIMEFRNGTAAAFPFGTQLHTLEMQGKGEAFIAAKSDCDRDIIGAILSQTLATEEGQHQARSAAQVHQDVLDTLIRQAKRGIVRMIRRDILRPWVIYNWGEKAIHLVPLVSLGHTQAQDLAPLMTAISQLMSSNYLDESQLPEIDEMLNLPVRDLSQDAPQDSPAAPPTPNSGATDAGRPGAGLTNPAPASSVPPNRIPVRGHSRGRPTRASMSEDKVTPKVGRRPGALQDVTYSEHDRRLIGELFEDAFPEYAGLLDAKVAGGK